MIKLKKSHYTIIKTEQLGNSAKFNSHKLQGYKVSPRNTKKYGPVEVNSMTLINPSFIEKILKRKIKKKLDFYLKYIISLIDEEDSDHDPSNLNIALDDLAHYKSIIEYKYRKFLDEKYINLLLKKIDILEHEIKTKMQYQQIQYYNNFYSPEPEYEEEKGRSR